MRSRVWWFVFGVLMCGQVAWGADRVEESSGIQEEVVFSLPQELKSPQESLS